MQKRSPFGSIIFFALIIGAFFAIRAYQGRSAPTPPAFTSPISLQEATERAETDAKPVLVLVTATWCPPCQSLKRGALADERVTTWIGENAVPVSLDADQHRAEAQSLGVRMLPTMILMIDGEEIARRTGDASADELIGWLKKNDAPARSATASTQAG